MSSNAGSPSTGPEAGRPVPPAAAQPESRTTAGPPPGPIRPRPAGEPQPIYPAEIHAPHAHRAPQAHRARPAPRSVGERRSLAARLGMAAIALVITAFFAAVGVASFAGGELLQGTMAVLGALLSAWVGLLTVRKG